MSTEATRGAVGWGEQACLSPHPTPTFFFLAQEGPLHEGPEVLKRVCCCVCLPLPRSWSCALYWGLEDPRAVQPQSKERVM